MSFALFDSIIIGFQCGVTSSFCDVHSTSGQQDAFDATTTEEEAGQLLTELHLNLTTQTARAVHDTASHHTKLFPTSSFLKQAHGVVPVFGIDHAPANALTKTGHVITALNKSIGKRLVVQQQSYATCYILLQVTSGLHSRAHAVCDRAVWVVSQVVICGITAEPHLILD